MAKRSWSLGFVGRDGWSVATQGDALAAHLEHALAIPDGGRRIPATA